MTPEQQRIAIAEACGIETWKGDCPDKSLTKEGKQLPDYLNDLNAMHEAEQMLGSAKANHSRYWITLHNMIVGELPDGIQDNWKSWRATGSATAPQRAEAFLRTLNLWTS